MPITPASFKRLRKPLTFAFAGEEAHIEYYPAAFSGEAMEQWNALAEQANAAGDDEVAAHEAALGFGRLLCGLLASWDYCEDPSEPDGSPGAPVPLTPERLLQEFGRYPLFFPEFLRCIIEAIGQDVTRGKASGTASPARSGATSSRTATSTSSKVKRSRRSSR